MVADTYVVGVDGGATKTVAVIGTPATILGRGESGSSNYHNIGAVAAGKAIRTAVLNAEKQAGLRRTRIRTAVVALAALDSKRGIQIARRFVREANIAETVFVIHDSVAAFYAATKGKPGIIVNSGTGSFAAGVNRLGNYVRVGGWGYLIDDEGSAFDIGMKAVTSGFRMIDGRTQPTQLIALLKNRFGVGMFDEILDRIYSGRISVEEIAELAPAVSKAASRDIACRQILREAGTSLAELVCTAASRLNMTKTSFPLIIVGGGFKSGRPFFTPFMSEVRRRCPRAKPVKLQEEPAKGAYLVAAKLVPRGPNALVHRDRWLRELVN